MNEYILIFFCLMLDSPISFRIKTTMIELTVKTLDSQNHGFSVPDDVSMKNNNLFLKLFYCL